MILTVIDKVKHVITREDCALERIFFMYIGKTYLLIGTKHGLIGCVAECSKQVPTLIMP
jgi:hypothetical protein